MMTPEEKERYWQWRQNIKFSDEEIAAALEVAAAAESNWPRRGELRELARRARRGYVGKAAVAGAARYLVTTCGICGQAALYHIGTEGRCSEHRQHLPGWHVAARERHPYQAEAERDERAREQRELNFARYRSARRRR